jgi:hypothetical protein
MVDFKSPLLNVGYFLPLGIASAVAILVALRARNGNAAALYAFFTAVGVSALGGAGMGVLLGVTGEHQSTWYVPSGTTAGEYGLFGAMIFGVIDGALGIVLGCFLAILCGAIVAGRLRRAAP